MTEVSKREYSELLEMLNYIPLRDYLKIPKEEISFLKEKKDENYDFKYDKSKSIIEQNVSKNTLTLFLKLYLDYIADEQSKEKIKDILRLNTLKNEQKKKEMISNKDIFNKKSNLETNSEISKNSEINLVEYKEKTKLQKIIEKIIKLIKKK